MRLGSKNVKKGKLKERMRAKNGKKTRKCGWMMKERRVDYKVKA